jgi:hypothetical protein
MIIGGLMYYTPQVMSMVFNGMEMLCVQDIDVRPERGGHIAWQAVLAMFYPPTDRVWIPAPPSMIMMLDPMKHVH